MQKNLRFSARRAFQGTVAFAAFGALSIAAATPASADTVIFGAGAAHVAIDAKSIVTETVPQGTETSASDTFQGAGENYLTVDAELSSRVDADGVHTTVVLNSARAEITQEDLNDILEELPDENVELNGSAEDVEELVAEAEAEDGEVGTFDVDENPLLVDATVTGASLTITKGWDGAVDTSTSDEGTLTVDTNVLELEIGSFIEDYDYEETLEEFDWAVDGSILYASFSMPGVLTINYPLAEVQAGLAEGEDDGDNQNPPPGGGDDDDDDDKDPGDDDDKDPGKDKDKDPGKEDGKESDDRKSTDDDLAVTGSPIAALIAGGAVIAAGGGAAAYLARRKKKNNEEFNETDES